MRKSCRRGAALSAVTVFSAVTIWMAATGALAQPGGPGCGGGGRVLEHLEHQLGRAGLPAATTQAVYQRIDPARAEQRPLEVSLDAAREQMHALLDQDKADVGAVMSQADAVGALETQLKKIGLQTLLEIRGLVTPEQWQALAPKHRGGRPDDAPPPVS